MIQIRATPDRHALLLNSVFLLGKPLYTIVSSPLSNAAVQAAIARALAYAPFADMLWVETSTPDLDEAQEFADAVHAKFPGKLLAYNCSPSFNWKRHLDDATIAEFQARALCCACDL